MCIKKFYHKFELPILIIADIILFAIAFKLDCLWITMPYYQNKTGVCLGNEDLRNYLIGGSI